jgi:hypothetical protein
MAYFDSLPTMEKDFDDQSNGEDFLLALQLHDQLNKEEIENEDQTLSKISQVIQMIFRILIKHSH